VRLGARGVSLHEPPRQVEFRREGSHLQRFLGMFNNGLTKVEDGLALVGGGIVCFMMVTTLVGVIGRVAHRPIRGEVETVTLIFVYVVMFSISFAQRRGEHLAVGIFFDRMKPGAQRGVLFVLLSIGLFICVILSWSTLVNTMWAYGAGDTIVGAIMLETWWARMAMPIGLMVVTVRLMVQLVQLARGEG